MSPLALSLRLLQTQPDRRLLALAAAGHEPAFEALVRRYRRPLLAYCRRIALDAGAEDVLQQALLQAWGALRAGVEVNDARAWLYRIVHNVTVSTMRSAGEPPAQLVETLAASGVEQIVEQRLAAREALASLAALPELQREVMLATALQGRSHQEVARELGLSGGSVRGLVYRARTALRSAAAALVPSPLIDWAVRHADAVGGGPIAEVVAGSGSVGVAGVLLKGGVAATFAGALAGAAAVVGSHGVHPVTGQPRTVTVAAHRRHSGLSERRTGAILLASTRDLASPGDAGQAARRPAGPAPGSRESGGDHGGRRTSRSEPRSSGRRSALSGEDGAGTGAGQVQPPVAEPAQAPGADGREASNGGTREQSDLNQGSTDGNWSGSNGSWATTTEPARSGGVQSTDGGTGSGPGIEGSGSNGSGGGQPNTAPPSATTPGTATTPTTLATGSSGSPPSPPSSVGTTSPS